MDNTVSINGAQEIRRKLYEAQKALDYILADYREASPKGVKFLHDELVRIGERMDNVAIDVR